MNLNLLTTSEGSQASDPSNRFLSAWVCWPHCRSCSGSDMQACSCSRPLHLPFALPELHFPKLHRTSSPASCKSLLKCHLYQRSVGASPLSLFSLCYTALLFFTALTEYHLSSYRISFAFLPFLHSFMNSGFVDVLISNSNVNSVKERCPSCSWLLPQA